MNDDGEVSFLEMKGTEFFQTPQLIELRHQVTRSYLEWHNQYWSKKVSESSQE